MSNLYILRYKCLPECLRTSWKRKRKITNYKKSKWGLSDQCRSAAWWRVSSWWSCGAGTTAGPFNQSKVRYAIDAEEDGTHAGRERLQPERSRSDSSLLLIFNSDSVQCMSFNIVVIIFKGLSTLSFLYWLQTRTCLDLFTWRTQAVVRIQILKRGRR